MKYLGLIVFCYLLGSIPCGLIYGKLLHNIDLRNHGSGNIGATNAWRTIGHQAGLTIFALDFLKGALAVEAAHLFFSHVTPLLFIIGGVMAIIGHSCSLFLAFKGGKGVATGLGVITMLMWQVAICAFILWFLIVIFTRYVSLASMMAAISVPLQALYWHEPWQYVLFGILAAAFVVYRHKANIERLRDGRESKIF